MSATAKELRDVFEWLRAEATKQDAPHLAGVALDEWHRLATAALAAQPEPVAWLCELAQEDGSVKTMIVQEDPEGLRFNDMGEPSPFRVTPLYTAPPAQPVAAQGWRPIETAPKDRHFLGWVSAVRYSSEDGGGSGREHDESTVDFCWYVSERPDETGGYFTNGSGQIGDAQDVTHWMPLPAAPGAAPAEPSADPMDWPLPCDVTVGHGTMRKGVSLRTLVTRMKVLYEMATGCDADKMAARTDDERAAAFADFRAQLQGAAPTDAGRRALTDAVINAARLAMDESSEAGDEASDITVPSHLAASLSLCLDEYDRAHCITAQPKGGQEPNAEFTGIGRNGATNDH